MSSMHFQTLSPSLTMTYSSFWPRSLAPPKSKESLKLTRRIKFQRFSKRCVCEIPRDAFGEGQRENDFEEKGNVYVIKTDNSLDVLTLEELQRLKYCMNRILGHELLGLLKGGRWLCPASLPDTEPEESWWLEPVHPGAAGSEEVWSPYCVLWWSIAGPL